MSILDNQQEILEDVDKTAEIRTKVCNRYRIIKVTASDGEVEYVTERKCRLFGFGPRMWAKYYSNPNDYSNDPRKKFYILNYKGLNVYTTQDINSVRRHIRDCIRWDLSDIKTQDIISIDTSILKD